MRYISTRDEKISLTIGEAMMQGLSKDGGLFVPKAFPTFDHSKFMKINSLIETAYEFLHPFFDGDSLQESLKSICENTFNFKIPLKHLSDNTSVLELFHGPTGAFKDVGARFLAHSIERLEKKATILVATSGDTGSAVAAAFHGLSQIEVVVLYPKDQISDFQEKQLTCWGDNVLALRVNGDFDDCQRLVKEAFGDLETSEKFSLTSANSINIGRLLPQCVYYVYSSISYFIEKKVKPNYIIPTGNMGNAMAAIWIKEMGFPIGDIILSCNENDSIVEYFRSREFNPKPSIRTLANAMDVGNPSNMERFLYLDNASQEIINYVTSYKISDKSIEDTIQRGRNKWGEIWCPHTATAVTVKEMLDISHTIVVSTAHPSKFKEIIEGLLNIKLVYPDTLSHYTNKKKMYVEINTSLSDLTKSLHHILGI